ncbi:MAG: hypothetical protein AB7Q00_13065 [Phycisphaerales bacterium]
MTPHATSNLATTDSPEASPTPIEPKHAQSESGLVPAEATVTESGHVLVRAKAGKPSLMDRLDNYISRLSTRNAFWQKVTSLIWLPYAFRSGIRLPKRLDENTYSAVLPYRRFNRNWYNAMAGASLLGNSEIAGGMYVFQLCGGEYTVVCKNLEYRFLRPCYGPAVYKITPREDAAALIASGKEFNLTIDMEIVQQPILPKKVRPTAEKVLPKSVGEAVAGKEKRVGKCVATFHITPKRHQVSKGRRIR